MDYNLNDLIQNVILKKENVIICVILDIKEIFNVLKNMDPIKALHLHGLPNLFYKGCWHIVRD